MRDEMSWLGTLLWFLPVFCLACAPSPPVSGVVQGTDGTPLEGVFVALLDSHFGVEHYVLSDAEGSFSFDARFSGQYLVVQPPNDIDKEGLGVFSHQPRVYTLSGSMPITLRLPPTGCLVLKAYDHTGTLMRWEDFERRGTFGGQFMYGTNLDDELAPGVVWAVHDRVSREAGAPQQKGLPSLVVGPGQVMAVQVLYWVVPGYGKLWLRADNAGSGFVIEHPGQAHVLELNVELARTALHALKRRNFTEASERIANLDERLQKALALGEPGRRALACDLLLAEALRLRDNLEYERARAAIPKVRQGTLLVEVRDEKGMPLEGCSLHVVQRSHDFLFGVFEGSPFNAEAFGRARESGFELATVLLGWNWAELLGYEKGAVDDLFGISALNALGYRVKAHGIVWLQEYGIMPKRAKHLNYPNLRAGFTDHVTALAGGFGRQIAVWEAMNEPATTNVAAITREEMLSLLAASSATIKKAMPQAVILVNGCHEFDFGRKYKIFGTDNQPKNDYSLTYSDFLRRAKRAGALDGVDIVGLQFYPGVHLDTRFGGVESPAVCPSWIVDTADRYSCLLGLPIHITEFSVPSRYGEDWQAGYWREPWNEDVQADYVDHVFTLAFGHPKVQSITWWDFTDLKPSVVAGGLLTADGRAKKALSVIEKRLHEWTTEVSALTDATGKAEVRGFAGDYELTLIFHNGTIIKQRFHLREGETTKLEIVQG